MTEPYRLKLKIGQHEFEAEGDPQVVHEQFQIFKELIADKAATVQPPMPPQLTLSAADPVAPPNAQPTQPARSESPATDLDLGKILRQDERVVSLTIRPTSIESAILLLMLGQKVLRTNDTVTGNEIISGLSATGGLSVQRPDRILEKLVRDGDVIAFGERRGKKYRLTNLGFMKARQIATEQISTVA